MKAEPVYLTEALIEEFLKFSNANLLNLACGSSLCAGMDDRF